MPIRTRPGAAAHANLEMTVVMSQAAKATRFRELHHSGRLLVLPNVWSPIGARLLESKGYPAIATASAAVSASLGYADGERLSRRTMFEMVERIVASVDLPVTADIEAGYGAGLVELEETAHQLLDTGVAGINLEDSLQEGGALRAVDEQCRRLERVRRVAAAREVPLVINARCDSFVSGTFGSAAERLDDCVDRARAYVAVGADCVYPMGPGDLETLRALRQRIEAPINVLVTAAAVPLNELEALGINRASLGPFVFRACLATFDRLADELLRKNAAPVFDGILTSDAVAAIVKPERETSAPSGEQE